MRRSLAGPLATLLGGLLLAGLLSGCFDSEERSPPPDTAQMIDEGSWYAREAWPHDGNPVESEHFVVYSDGAGMAARERLASLAEDVYAEVIDEMDVDPASMFKFPADQKKVDRVKVNPLIATLGMMSVVRGIVLLLTIGRRLFVVG